MKHLLFSLFLVFLAAPSWADCLSPVALTTGYSAYFRVGPPSPGQNTGEVSSLSVSFEPDATGSESTAVLGLQFCSRESADSCGNYNFDTDADGLGDTNLLDASTIEKSGVKGISGFLYLRVYASTNPSGTDEPEFTICRTKN